MNLLLVLVTCIVLTCAAPAPMPASSETSEVKRSDLNGLEPNGQIIEIIPEHHGSGEDLHLIIRRDVFPVRCPRDRVRRGTLCIKNKKIQDVKHRTKRDKIGSNRCSLGTKRAGPLCIPDNAHNTKQHRGKRSAINGVKCNKYQVRRGRLCMDKKHKI